MNNTSITKLDLYNGLQDYMLSEEEEAEFMKNIDMDAVIEGIKKSEQEIAEGKGIEFREATSIIHKEVFGEEIQGNICTFFQ